MTEQRTEIQVTDAQFRELFDQRHAGALACGHWAWDDGQYWALGGTVCCPHCGTVQLVVGVGELTTPKRTGGSRG